MPSTNFEWQTPESLENIARHIEESAAVLRAHCESMQTHNVGRLYVGNDSQMKLARQNLDRYCGAVREALRKAKEQRGDFIGGNGKKQKPKKGES